MIRTNPCAPGVAAGRLAKARQFAQAAATVNLLAEDGDDVRDAVVTLAVHAGIAAADSICCARLGAMARGEHHDQGISWLERADKEAAKHLRVLLGLKTRAGYSHASITEREAKRALRAMEHLLAAAQSA
jgi:hypothetical protein